MLGQETGLSDLFWLTDERIERLRSFFPESHDRLRVDNRECSGHRFRQSHVPRWRDAPSAYGFHKTPYNRWKRWVRLAC